MTRAICYRGHLNGSKSLVTLYEQTRAGFIALALEKNRKASPFVEEAKALKVLASQAENAQGLLGIPEIQGSILTAAGISAKANSHLTENNRIEAIKGLINKFLEPAGKDFVDELVYRFLLTRGDSLGGSIRNLAGAVGERKFTRAMISTLSIEGKNYRWFHSKSRQWIDRSADDADIELHLKGLHWQAEGPRTLVYNLTVPVVQKNVDLSILAAAPDAIDIGNNRQSAHREPRKYLALGELKGGIDPAGADEHWKTANSALERIRKGFKKSHLTPKTFFVGAAIEKSMADEIYRQLRQGVLSNAANLTSEKQVVSICKWLIHL